MIVVQTYPGCLSAIKRQAVFFTAQSLFLIFFFHLNDLSTLVMSAAWADPVRKSHLTAVRALYQVLSFQGIMRPPAVAFP